MAFTLSQLRDVSARGLKAVIDEQEGEISARLDRVNALKEFKEL
jgi:hypothetical protein